MSKRKISHRQHERIKRIQELRRERAQEKAEHALEELEASSLGPEQAGLLVAHYGPMADVEYDGKVTRCLLRQNLGLLVVGDQVIWRESADGGGVVVALEPRQSVIGRPDARGEIRPIAANINQIIIVAALKPELLTSLIDSYLVAAETLSIPALIVLNKIELDSDGTIAKRMETYRNIGYDVVLISVKENLGLEALTQTLAGKTSVFVGQSGVGKSSIIAMYKPTDDIKVGALAKGTGFGSHTTSTSRLYHLDSGGRLIDSPGIREFGLWNMTAEQVAVGFREFKPYLGQCKFRDCKHQREPGCALQKAVAKGAISEERFNNFLKLCTQL